MKLNLDTTSEQDAALSALNKQSNSGNLVPEDEFALSVITDHLQSLIVSIKQIDIGSQVKVLQDNADKLSDADAATLKAIAAKYQAQAAADAVATADVTPIK